MKVLFLIHPYPNYVPDLLLHGLRKLIGPAAVDFPRKTCLYEGVLGLGVCPPNQLCPGWFPADEEQIDRNDVPHKIMKGFFDCIVSDVRALGQWMTCLEQSRTPLAIIDGEDRPVPIQPDPILYFGARRMEPTAAFRCRWPCPRRFSTGSPPTIRCRSGIRSGFWAAPATTAARNSSPNCAAYPDGRFSASVVPSDQTPFPQGRYGRDAYYRELQACRVVLSLPGAGNDTFRFWENAGCNAVHMARRVPVYIPDDFCDGETILRFRGIEDMRPRIDAALNANEVSRELIASGRYHLFRFHLTTHRARYFLDRIVERRSGSAGQGRRLKTPLRNSDTECSVPVQTGEGPLYLGLVEGNNYGWGVCSRYLIRELSRLTDCRVLNAADGSTTNGGLEGRLFQALTGVDFFPMFPKARGRRNYGYTFFENELTRHSIENAKTYDLVLAGSSWCRDRLFERGIENCEVLIQGIDPQLYQPRDEEPDAERFIIFSGGKFELRKGQDLVLRAFKVLQDKYPDIWLVNCWYNLWPESLHLMKHSRHIRFEAQDGPWQTLMQRTYALNGLDASRIVTCDLMSSELLPELYHRSHIGVFPNRCEGGTNLVLMEYMACGKPVIATNGSGHRDIVTKDNALMLNDLSEYRVVGADNALIARWQEPSLDELIARLEWAYQHREAIRTLGRRAGEDLKGYTWETCARRLLNIID